jgi:hypothetical protein
MDNLTRLFERDQKWYKLGPIVIGRGLSKRVPLYFLAFSLCFLLLRSIPCTPFWFVEQTQVGWLLNLVVFPFLAATWLSNLQTAGKTPERYLYSWFRFAWSKKHVTPYRVIDRPWIAQFAKEVSHEASP